jgi:small-conductance mechanosensitive channel
MPPNASSKRLLRFLGSIRPMLVLAVLLVASAAVGTPMPLPAALLEDAWDPRAELAAIPPSSNGDAQTLRQKRAVLTSLVAAMDLAEVRRAREDSRRSALAPDALPPLPSGGPVSMLRLDAWRDARDATRAELATLDDELGALRIEATERAGELRKAREEYRLWRERATIAGDDVAASAQAEADLRLWHGRYAEFLHGSATRAIDAIAQQRTELESRLLQFDRHIAPAIQRQVFDASDVQRIDALQGAERVRAEARITRFTKVVETQGRPFAASARAAEEELLAVIAGRDPLWRLRGRVIGRDDAAEADDALAPILADALRQVSLRERWVGAELDDALAEQASNTEPDGVLADAAAEDIRSRRRLLDALKRSRILLERATEDLAVMRAGSTGTFSAAWRAIAGFARELWEWELFVVTDRQTIDGRDVVQEHGVTLGKGLGALLLLGLGYWVVGALGRLLRRRILPWFGIAPQTARTVSRWIGGLLMLVVVLFILKIARIPLVAFAFLGGALAIGIGFGAQTLLKNVMSGALILLERRIRVGDVLTVGGTSGTCTDVGLRSTTLAGFDGIDVIVPNSVLLEAAVSNWTGSSQFVRREVALTIPCDGNEGRIAELARECAVRSAGVRSDPPPKILFTRFVDGGVELTVQFWIQVGGTPSAPEIESQLRFELTRTLVDLGITMLPPTRVTLVGPIGRPIAS